MSRQQSYLRYRWRLRLAEPRLEVRHGDDLHREHREHRARTVTSVGIAALDLQDAHRAVA